MKNKKGFTLVELLAVIVILGVVLLIAVPKIISTIENARLSTIKSSVKTVASSAEREYTKRDMLGTLDEVSDEIECDDVAQLSGSNYSSCAIEFNSGSATVSLVGSNNFEGYECTGNSVSVTCIVNSVPERTNTDLDNVRYIKDCLNGSSVNDSNHWVEIKAIDDEVNVALNKTVTGTVAYDSEYLPYSAIVDNDTASSHYSMSSVNGELQCVTIDLEEEYYLDSITVWHYYNDGRIYNANVTYVSRDNTNWTTVINTTEAETSSGKTVSAY